MAFEVTKHSKDILKLDDGPQTWKAGVTQTVPLRSCNIHSRNIACAAAVCAAAHASICPEQWPAGPSGYTCRFLPDGSKLPLGLCPPPR